MNYTCLYCNCRLPLFSYMCSNCQVDYCLSGQKIASFDIIHNDLVFNIPVLIDKKIRIYSKVPSKDGGNNYFLIYQFPMHSQDYFLIPIKELKAKLLNLIPFL